MRWMGNSRGRVEHVLVTKRRMLQGGTWRQYKDFYDSVFVGLACSDGCNSFDENLAGQSTVCQQGTADVARSAQMAGACC